MYVSDACGAVARHDDTNFIDSVNRNGAGVLELSTQRRRRTGPFSVVGKR